MLHPSAYRLTVPALALALGLGACGDPPKDPASGGGDETGGAGVDRGPAPAVTPAAPALRRLTRSQYENALRDLFAGELYVPTNLEPDNDVEGLLSVGASTTSVSAYGVELYEAAARTVAEQVMASPEARAALVQCTPAGPDDAGCAGAVLGDLARRAWRRPITADERDRLTALAVQIGEAEGSFDVGLTYGLVAILQSPHFLYRREHGEGTGTVRALTAVELASRVSFLVWNSIPDAELLAAAEDGSLLDDAVLEAQTRRLLAHDNARRGLRNLFDEIFHLYNLPSISKDPLVFTNADPALGASAREETLLGIEAVVLDEDGDFRDLLTTERTFVDRRLAALYGVAAATPEGFGAVWLDPSLGRRGLLGQASFLMLQSHATSSSATKRGKFVRTTLLCQEIPAPPAGVDTSIPEADATSPTLRERLQTHLTDPYCASCHRLTDPIGLGFENFDGIGKWRTTENGAIIDASGDLDGVAFANAFEIGAVVHDSPHLGPCFTRHVYRYGVGRVEGEGEGPLLDWLGAGFAGTGYSFRELLVDTVLSPGFRTVGELQ